MHVCEPCNEWIENGFWSQTGLALKLSSDPYSFWQIKIVASWNLGLHVNKTKGELADDPHTLAEPAQSLLLSVNGHTHAETGYLCSF